MKPGLTAPARWSAPIAASASSFNASYAPIDAAVNPYTIATHRTNRLRSPLSGPSHSSRVVGAGARSHRSDGLVTRTASAASAAMTAPTPAAAGNATCTSAEASPSIPDSTSTRPSTASPTTPSASRAGCPAARRSPVVRATHPPNSDSIGPFALPAMPSTSAAR